MADFDQKRTDGLTDQLFEILDQAIDSDHLREFIVAIGYVSGMAVGEMGHDHRLGGPDAVNGNFTLSFDAGIRESQHPGGGGGVGGEFLEDVPAILAQRTMRDIN